MFNFPRNHDFLVAIDSDGCVFDTMELKHKECFVPLFIEHYHLQGVSKFARETWEFVNLYSQSRGLNRFPALVETLDRLQQRPEVLGRGVKVETPPSLREWVATETRLGNPTLKERVEVTGDPALRACLAWSLEVNAWVDRMVRNVTPFRSVRESLAELQRHADLIVCSATPSASLEKEWAEQDLKKFVAGIAGQEAGTKKEILAAARNYPPGHVLMIGDAPGDQRAAAANGALFFPINPGQEEASWQNFFAAGLSRFFSETFAGEYQVQLQQDFERLLPAEPLWKTSS